MRPDDADGAKKSKRASMRPSSIEGGDADAKKSKRPSMRP